MIRFPCPNCETALKVADDRAGEKIKCPECSREVPVPEDTGGDEPPVTERDSEPRRKMPRWAWGCVGIALLTVIGGIVAAVVVLTGPRDGMTRAERAAFESNFRSELIGVWDAMEGPEWKKAEEGSRHLFTFTEDGRFEAVRYYEGKKVGSHAGKWSVTGQKLAIEVTESGDDYIGMYKMVPSDISEVKSEKGKMFKFHLDHYQQRGYHTFRRWVEPPKPQPKPAAPQAKKEEALTEDQQLMKWLPGRWSSEVGATAWEWRFDELGFYEVTVAKGGQSLGSFSGQWFVRAGQLTLTVGVSFYEPVPPNSSRVYTVAFPAENGFTLTTALKEYFTTLGRKK